MLSIATVVFNDPAGLKKTIDSVRVQKNKGAEIEFVVADGGSELPTLKVLNDESDVIDAVLYGPDNGIYDGMNSLLEAASGEAIIFINAGDVLFDKMDLVSIMKSYELDKRIHYGKVIQRYNNDCYMRPKSTPDKLNIKDVSHQAFFVPREIYKSVSYDLNYAVSSDKLWIKECVCRGETVYIDEVISVFELGGVSNSSSFKSLFFKLKESTSLTRKLLQFIKFLLKAFCTQAFYYRVIYFFKYKYSRCEDMGWGL